MSEQSTQGPAGGRRPHVVIVGGGFAGLTAARALRTAPVDVTLVDRHTYNVFQPLLYQVATAGLNPGDVTYFLRAARMRQRNLRVRQGEVVGIDPVERSVTFADGWSVGYDYLVLASGAATNYFGTPGAEAHGRAIYTRAQALAVRDDIFTQLEHAAASSSSPDLAIAVVGGGPTGVEMAGALAEWRNTAMAAVYPELDVHRTRIMLLEMGHEVLASFAPSLRGYAARALRARGVELRLGTAVAEVRADGVQLATGEFLPAGVVVWAAGVRVPEIVRTWGVPQDPAGRIQVQQDLRVVGHDTVFAAGDVAIGPDRLPQLAQPAIQAGRHAGRQIANLVAGRPVQRFRYHDKGTLATIGRRAAVAEIELPVGPSVRLTGTLAWFVWLYVHIVMLLGNRNRLATLVNLTTKYFAPSRRSNPIVGDVPIYQHRDPSEHRLERRARADTRSG
jgi:NADH dehydrogenase